MIFIHIKIASKEGGSGFIVSADEVLKDATETENAVSIILQQIIQSRLEEIRAVILKETGVKCDLYAREGENN